MTSDPIPSTLLAATENPVADSGSRASPGRAVREARERARLSLEELAMQTKLARGTLEALERDDFATLAEPVYARGYYRKCAKALGLSDAELIATYEKLVAPRAPQAPTKLLLGSSQTMTRTRPHRRGSSGRWGWVIGAAVLIGVLAWALSTDPGALGLRPAVGPTNTAATPPSSASIAPAPATATDGRAIPAPAPPPVALTSSDALSTSKGAGLAAAPPPVVAPSAPPAAAPAPPASAAVPVPAAAVAGVLGLKFRSTSWVRVEDADGRVLLSGVVQAGDHQSLSGRAPYSLFVGNAPGVTVEYDGRSVDLTPYIKPNSTARFSVP